MSIRVMTRVWDHARAEGGALLVLLALGDFADDDGYCYPKEQQIAQKARLSDRQVRVVLKALAERREIAYQTGRGRGARSWYVVLSGLPDDRHGPLIAGLDDRINRKELPVKEAGKRKINPVKSSAFSDKTGSLRQLKPEVCDSSTGDLPPSDGSNGDPNRHVIRHDPPPQGPAPAETPPPDAASPGGGGGDDSPTPDPETARILRELKISPAVRRELACVPAPVAQRTLDACRKIPGARDVPALVVAHLRAYRTTGEELAPLSAPAPTRPQAPPPLPDAPPLSSAEMRAILAAKRQEMRL